MKNTCSNTRARVGELMTPHGIVTTPVFLPVGSQGSVKTVTPAELHQIGTTMILSNTYHLYLRPGIEIIERMGGLHAFMGWNKPILSDSGGYQVFSLAPLCKIANDGVVFRSHIDGSEHLFSPENVIKFQERLGVDVMMPLDHCVSTDEDKHVVSEAMKRTHLWAEMCLRYNSNKERLLFAIVQGGLYPDLRRNSAQVLIDMDFPGYAIGGLSLGESKSSTWEMVQIMTSCLPELKPRYLMGVGSPEDILEGVNQGIDIFDSALPTRVARNGALFSETGRQNITKSVFNTRREPFDENCDCYMCRNFSAAYIHHLFRSGELLAYRLATIHNLRFIVKLMENIRIAIQNDTFNTFKIDFLSRYETTNEASRILQKQRWMQNQRNKCDLAFQ